MPSRGRKLSHIYNITYVDTHTDKCKQKPFSIRKTDECIKEQLDPNFVLEAFTIYVYP